MLAPVDAGTDLARRTPHQALGHHVLARLSVLRVPAALQVRWQGGSARIIGVGRVVGLDVGERRIGVAVSDSTGTLARPLGVVRIAALDTAAVARLASDLERLAAEEDGLARVVVGLPRRLDGGESPMTARVTAFARQLEHRIGRAVLFQDERLSSVEAESRLAVNDRNWKTRKARLDAAAAAVILQDYLDLNRDSPAAGPAAGLPPADPSDR
jgi:putative Holliday junction resolvase